MQAKHNVLMGFFFGAQYHSKISGVHGFLRVRSCGMIRIRINDPTSLRSECIKGTTKSHLEKDSLVPFMHHDPRDLGNEKGTGDEMLPASVCGIVTGDANSPRSLWLIWFVPVPFSFLKWHLEFNSKWYTLINPLHRDDSPEHSIPSPTNPGLQTHRRPPNTSSTHRPLGWHFWGHFSLPTKDMS